MGLDLPQELDPLSGFFALGMTSLASVELRTRLQVSLGQPLSASVLFDHPTVTRLTDRLYIDLFGGEGEPQPAPAQPRSSPLTSRPRRHNGASQSPVVGYGMSLPRRGGHA